MRIYDLKCKNCGDFFQIEGLTRDDIDALIEIYPLCSFCQGEKERIHND